VEIVPNPFGGVNTHLWSKEAYIVGIVPLIRPAYSKKKRMEKEEEIRACLLGALVRDRRRRATHNGKSEPS